jgi:hypothetical protein
MGDTPVKCSSCDVQAQVVLEGDTPKEVVCPRCGVSESYADFQRSVGHQASAYAAEEIGKVFRDMARRSRSVTYKPGNLQSNNPKFCVEFPG